MLNPDNAHNYWTGLTDTANEGSFVWTDGTPMSNNVMYVIIIYAIMSLILLHIRRVELFVLARLKNGINNSVFDYGVDKHLTG